jgi:hypothetical protein
MSNQQSAFDSRTTAANRHPRGTRALAKTTPEEFFNHTVFAAVERDGRQSAARDQQIPSTIQSLLETL